MRIDRIELFLCRLPLVHFFETSFGRSYDRTFVLIRVEGGGLEGWGEAVAEANPYYSSETTETVWHIVTGFVARTPEGRITTLGRNGSDYSGAIFAALFGADGDVERVAGAVRDAAAGAMNPPVVAHRVVVFGAGGHARVCLEALAACPDLEVVGCVSRDGTGVAES